MDKFFGRFIDKKPFDEEGNISLKPKIFDIGQMQVFKKKLPTDIDYQEDQQAGDYCIGFVYNESEELEFIMADFLGGDKLRKVNYDI